MTRGEPALAGSRAGAGTVWLLGLLLGAALLLGWGVDDRPLQDVDEGIHASVSLETVQRGEPLNPTLGGEPYHRKPPLKLWLSSGLMWLRGPDLWSVRLPSTLAGIALALLLGLWALQLGGSRTQGLLTGLCLASMRPTFFHSFRSGEMDALLTLGVSAALYGWWRARTEGAGTRWPLFVGCALALGFMSKAFAGLLPLLVIAVDALIADRRRPSWRAVGLCAATFLLLTAPWHLLMTVEHGQAFWDRYLGVEVLERVRRSMHTAERGDGFYLGLLPSFLFPLSLVLVPGLLWGAREVARARGRDDRRAAGLRLLLLWFGLGLLAVTVMRSKASWYLIPALPPAVLLAVEFLCRARPLAGDRLADAGHLVVVWTGAAVLPALVLDAEGLARWRDMHGTLTHPAVVASLATAVAAVVALLLSRLPWRRALPAALPALVLLAHGGVWWIEVHRLPAPTTLQPVLDILAAEGEVGLTCLGPLHDREPAAWFELLRSERIELRRARTWQEVGDDGFVLVAGASAPPVAWTTVTRCGDYRLLRRTAEVPR